ncbi:hypothetical protein EUX53_18745 [Pseudomonas orientalis]|nr:hypothetical protein EUX53_18745 [Pseudomonas orientalis]
MRCRYSVIACKKKPAVAAGFFMPGDLLEPCGDSTVGGGLPPIAVYQPPTYWLTHCHRGQAPSHIWISSVTANCAAMPATPSGCESLHQGACLLPMPWRWG